MSRFPTIALALAIATSAAAQTDAKKVAPGRYYFTSEGKYLAPMALSLEVESRSASLVVALPGSPYLVTKVNPTEIEFEGVQKDDLGGLLEKGKWRGTFDRVHGTVRLFGPQARKDASSNYHLTCRPAQRLF